MSVKITVNEQRDITKEIRKIREGVDLLLRIGQENMSAISNFHTAAMDSFGRMEASLAVIAAGIEGLKQGVTEADQTRLNDMQQKIEGFAQQIEQTAAQVSQG